MEKRKVDIKDYERNRHLFLVLLNSLGIMVDYTTVDLIYMAQTKYIQLGSAMTINDTIELKDAHTKKWDDYFKKKDSKEVKVKSKNK